jgi:sensor domain DACNV-containing protein
MENTISYPKDLAEVTRKELCVMKVRAPSVQILTTLFEIMYMASMRTEESQAIACTITYIQPGTFDKFSLAIGRTYQWSVARFDKRLPFTVSDLVKISKAVDPEVSSLAVYANKHGELFIWGIIDQALHYNSMINLESDEIIYAAGDFQATITGPASISVYKESDLIASLKPNSLIREYHEVFWLGPISKVIHSCMRDYIKEVKQLTGKDIYESLNSWDPQDVVWEMTLCRILLNAQRYRHGGAFLIIPNDSEEGLNIKYRVNYDRLYKALLRHAEKALARTALQVKIDYNYLEESDYSMVDIPANAHLTIRMLENEVRGCVKEVSGCVRFISSLACIDGLVLLDRKMVVRGFGVEINTPGNVSNVFVAGDALGSVRNLRKVDFNHFGTRHRSMMRYCYFNNGSIGFVISQDGEIRAITRKGKKLILWENIRVQGFHKRN